MKVIRAAARTLIYALLLVVLIVSVMIRRSAVDAERASVPVSYVEEVKKYGKPVTVLGVKNEVFTVKEKFTIVPVDDVIFEGYVTRSMASALKEGQQVNALNGHTGISGRISYLSPEVDMMSGLYRMEVEFAEPVVCDKGKLLVETNVGIKKDIIEVPNDALSTEEGRFFLWKVLDGKAHRSEVKLSARSGYSSIVSEGLDKDDILVITGQSRLKEGDRVRIIDKNGNNR